MSLHDESLRQAIVEKTIAASSGGDAFSDRTMVDVIARGVAEAVVSHLKDSAVVASNVTVRTDGAGKVQGGTSNDMDTLTQVTVSLPYDYPNTDYKVLITPIHDPGAATQWWTSNKNVGDFKINVDTDPAKLLQFNWFTYYVTGSNGVGDGVGTIT